jgi:pyruvate-formate lyase-activating enzyme
MGPTKKNYFFYYQTLVYVATGEPHPQLHYQTAWFTRSHITKQHLKVRSQLFLTHALNVYSIKVLDKCLIKL